MFYLYYLVLGNYKKARYFFDKINQENHSFENN